MDASYPQSRAACLVNWRIAGLTLINVPSTQYENPKKSNHGELWLRQGMEKAVASVAFFHVPGGRELCEVIPGNLSEAYRGLDLRLLGMT